MGRICKFCNKELLSTSYENFCDASCCGRYGNLIKHKSKPIIVCLSCGIETTNPKFCSRSCSAKLNNKLHPKRKQKRIKYCTICNSVLGWTRRKYCQTCWTDKTNWDRITYRQISGVRKYQKNSRIRAIARQEYYASNRPRQCYICGYNKHYEVCHIKPIKDFDLDTPVSVINHPNNLIALCPNHHWELDNGLISIA